MFLLPLWKTPEARSDNFSFENLFFQSPYPPPPENTVWVGDQKRHKQKGDGQMVLGRNDRHTCPLRLDTKIRCFKALPMMRSCKWGAVHKGTLFYSRKKSFV